MNTHEKSAPMVSIIVPNYNYARFLEERMWSIFTQTFTDYEIILLDDASTDNSIDMLRKYAEHPAVSHLYLNEINSGNPFVQWRKGIGFARGKYIWIAESDDSADSRFLERCVELMERHEEAVICFSASILVDEYSNPYTDTDADHWHRRGIVPDTYYLYDGNEFNKHCQIWDNHIYNASGVVFRNSGDVCEIIDLVVRYRYAGDWFFWTRMAMTGDVIILNERLNRFRRHSMCVTNVGRKNTAYLEEEVEYVKMMFSLYDIGRYRRVMRVGSLIRKIRRYKFDTVSRQHLMNVVAALYGSNVQAIYWLYYANRVLAKIFHMVHIEQWDYMHPAPRHL